MECPVDPNMSITGITHAKWYGAPGPMFCGPKTNEQPFSGFWDYSYECKCFLLLLAFCARTNLLMSNIFVPTSCFSFQATRDGPTRQNLAMPTKAKRQVDTTNRSLMLAQVSHYADISLWVSCLFQRCIYSFGFYIFIHTNPIFS